MSFTNTQIEKIIHGTGKGKEIGISGFRTPQPTLIKSLEEDAGNSNLKGIITPRRGKSRGGGGGRGGGRGVFTLKQRKLEDSLKDNKLKRKERSPEESADKVKKEKTEEGKYREEKDEEGEDKEQVQEAEPGNMEQIVKMLEEMNTKMDKQREERKKMMQSWEKRYDALKEIMNKKIDDGMKRLEDKLKEEGEERKRASKEWREEWKREETARESKLDKERAERKEEIKGILEKIEKLEKLEDRQAEKDRNPGDGERGESKAAGFDKRQILEMEWRIEEGERDRKRNNLVITGWQEERWDRETMEKWFKEKLEIEVELEKTWIIKGKIRRIGAECKNGVEKGEIMREKSKLQGSNIFINNDLTWKERRNKDKLWEIAVKLRKEGKQIKIGYNKLWIDGVEHMWSEREQELFRRKKRTGEGNRKEERGHEDN